MFAKRFFYVCAGLFLLALSFQMGARSAGAQSGGFSASWVGQAGGAGPYYVAALRIFGRE